MIDDGFPAQEFRPAVEIGEREKMTKFRVFLIVFAMLCLQRSASSQAVSGASFITGFELGSLAEGFGTLNGGAVQSGTKRSGNYAYEARAISSNPTMEFGSRSS